MRKNGIYMIIALTVNSLLLLPTFSLALTNQNVTFSNSGIVQYSPPPDPLITPIKKFTHVYGAWLDSSGTTFLATHFDTIVTEWDGGYGLPRKNEMASLKQQNPDIKIYGYKLFCGSYGGIQGRLDEDWSVVTQHEDWFIHDANGARIIDRNWGDYLMDIGSTGWRQHWVDYVNSEMASVPEYDGAYADIVYSALIEPSTFNRVNPNGTIPQHYLDSWHSDVVGMLQYIKAHLTAGKKLIINSEEGFTWLHETIDFLNVVDGQEIEGFCHAPWVGSSSFPSTYTFTIQLSFLSTGVSSGKIMLTGSGCLLPHNEQVLKLCYADYLLGAGGTSYWGWNEDSQGWYDYHTGYQPIMATDIGSPTGAYYSSQGIYMRDFTSGKVLFNPSANSYTISLGGNYRLLNGTVVSSIVLISHSGEILLSSP